MFALHVTHPSVKSQPDLGVEKPNVFYKIVKTSQSSYSLPRYPHRQSSNQEPFIKKVQSNLRGTHIQVNIQTGFSSLLYKYSIQRITKKGKDTHAFEVFGMVNVPHNSNLY
jgi:hypothetical protein